MVFPPTEGRPDTMAAAADAREKPQSSHQLHNFSFPVLKTWGNQRMLRCANVNRKGEIIGDDRRPSPPAAAGERRATPPATRIGGPEEEAEGGGGGGDDGGIEELREKLMGHLREAADRMKIGVPPPFLGGAAVEEAPAADEEAPAAKEKAPAPAPAAKEKEKAPAPAPASARTPDVGPSPSPDPSPLRPWNLRTRRPACKDSIVAGGRQPSSKPAPAAASVAAAEKRSRERTLRLRSESAEKRGWPKFSVSLTPEEIEEDIYALTGSRPRRRPKKRPRNVQRRLDSLFPGLWLSEITADWYKVPDDNQPQGR